MKHRSILVASQFLLLGYALPPDGAAQVGPVQSDEIQLANCEYSAVSGVMWYGVERQMTIQQLAEYAAPIYWFSPDEPSMDNRSGKRVRVPEPLPFEDVPDAPVVYYQFNTIYQRTDGDGAGYVSDDDEKASSIIDFHNAAAINLKYIAYFAEEEGLGGHAHDVEPAEFRLWIARTGSEKLAEELEEIGYSVQCDRPMYVVGVKRISAEAHGLQWFWNVLEVDQYTQFPFTLTVEEGKHGLCTDKNGDGVYTPGYDVNVRINDAWGLRDIIRGGTLFTGKFEAWMAKNRVPQHRVFPPLPEDSHVRQMFVEQHPLDGGEYAPNNAVYELRPFPSSDLAGEDALLHEKMSEKEEPDWPETPEMDDVASFSRWWSEGTALRSLAISVRYDGHAGLSWVFPLLVIRNFEEPLSGGWLVHRMYVTGPSLTTFGWQIMHMPSASRWFDTYVAGGVEFFQEVDAAGTAGRSTAPVVEVGAKLRANITKSPLKFLSFLTDFMGVRAGVLSRGVPNIENLRWVFEFGAGVW